MKNNKTISLPLCEYNNMLSEIDKLNKIIDGKDTIAIKTTFSNALYTENNVIHESTWEIITKEQLVKHLKYTIETLESSNIKIVKENISLKEQLHSLKIKYTKQSLIRRLWNSMF